jgi:hypothetical protein
MGWTVEELRGYLRVCDVAKAVLEELKAAGFKFKMIERIRFCPYPGTAAWQGIDEETGYITVYLGCQAGAIAHELGHGFHECLRRDYSLPNRFGEDYAEAIRWFTEQRIGPSAWCLEFMSRKSDDALLIACNYDWLTFVDLLKKGLFYPE